MKFLDKAQDDYIASGEPDWERLKEASSHPELIGRKPSDVGSDAPMYWLRCGCGMLVGTSEDYAGDESICVHCAGEAKRPSASSREPNSGQMPPRVERHIRLALVAFVLLAAVMVGTSVANGGSRPDAPMRQLD